MRFKTLNPATEEVIAEYETMSQEFIFELVESCERAYRQWRNLELSERMRYIRKLSEVLNSKLEDYAKIITLEMGKPITESRAELQKCAWMADVYAKNAAAWLAAEEVVADGKKHEVIYQPLGIILSIMPWNFPFWQALRFAVPTLLAGNVSILKHSNIVPHCALAIEDALKSAGVPVDVFRTIIADHESTAMLIADDRIRGLSFTGSTWAGAKIAQQAGKHLKKTVLELGGSDPFIVLEDADLELTAKNAVLGRTINTGQSCIAAKRFIVVEPVAEQFSKKFAELMNKLVVGDPMDERTNIGPLVNEQAITTLEEQVKDAVVKGAVVLTGGKRIKRKGYFYEPTVLGNATSDMKVVNEEVFAPVAPVIVVEDETSAIRVANASEFGLGGSVWTKDIERGENIAKCIESGTVFVNSITKSDPRMPFGGVKKSGYGRELGKFGIKEFVNVKGINIYEHK